MSTRYDAEADALYVRFAEADIIESEEIRAGVVFDFDKDRRIVAIELLDASQHLPAGADLRALAVA